jgi:nitroreductase
MIVPSYYRTIISDSEKNMGYSLEDSNEKDMLLLRKYAHIIDKGLHRTDVESGHSEIYCKLLKVKLQKLSHTPYSVDPTYKWAQDKIEAYEKLQNQPNTYIPLQSDFRQTPLSYDDLFSLMKLRRSNRIFKELPISEKTIDKIIEPVNWAANSCNKQPISIFKTSDPCLAIECLKCCKGGTGFGKYIPSFFVFAADSRGYVWPDEIFLPMIDTALGAQNLFLAAQTLGITGTILSWSLKDNEDECKLRKFLSIPPEYVIVFCAVLGYAAFNYIQPQRKNIK